MTTTTRIEPLSPAKASPLTRLMYRFARRRFGEVPEPFTVYAHHKGLLTVAGTHEMMLERASKVLPANVRELAVYWTARQIGCSWCVDFGAMLQRLDGLDVDRLKELIISGGFNISPSEVEQALLLHPDIVDAAVVGLPRASGGEQVAAAVVLREGAVFDDDAIREWMRGQLTAYKVPKTMVQLDTLPRSLVGKVQRREVREELLRRRVG